MIIQKLILKSIKSMFDSDYYFLGYQHDKGTFYKTEFEAHGHLMSINYSLVMRQLLVFQ